MNWSEMIQKRRQKEKMFFDQFRTALGLKMAGQRIEKSVIALSFLEQRAITLRFISSLPIARIADAMGMSWDGANELIERAVVRIQKQPKR